MESEKTYFYPDLSDYDFGWFRLSGPGLANCMFVAARAYILSRRENAGYISPTWTKLSPGTFLRREKDKRVYFKIFNKLGISGFKKIRLLLAGKLRPGSRRVKQIRGMGEYFDDLNEHMDLVHEFIEKITRKEIIENVRPEALKDSIAIHVRLGDYSPEMRVDILWYVNLVKEILSIKPSQQFLLFSDGSDEELRELLALPNVRRAFYGNAYADMYAISKCKWVIASDSTFSAWGAFMGERPILFNKRHFKRVFRDRVPEAVLGDSTRIPDEFKTLL